MRRYYAELLDITDQNDIILYGYAFSDRNILSAKIHATQVCREMKIVPLPSVWRISKEKYNEMIEKYYLPRPIRINGDAPE